MPFTSQHLHGQTHQVHGAKSMVKTGMQSPRIDQMCHSQLFDIPQPLKIRMRNQIKYQGRWYSYEPVNRVIYYFLFIQGCQINYTVQKLLFLLYFKLQKSK